MKLDDALLAFIAERVVNGHPGIGTPLTITGVMNYLKDKPPIEFSEIKAHLGMVH